MIASYHNHSTWSDGQAMVGELAEAAALQGISDLGVSDHYLAECDGTLPGWALPYGALDAYVEEIRSFDKRRGVRMRAGLEIDWFPAHVPTIEALLKETKLDFVIGSVHYVGAFPIDGSPGAWRRLSQDDRDQMHRAYWAEVRAMAQSRLFDIVGHIDLAKKFAFYPQVDLSEDIDAALDAIAESEMVVELNTAGWHKPCADAYPSLDILKRCRGRDIAVMISSDSHRPGDLLRDFRPAAGRLREAGYEQVVRFERRERRLEPIADAVQGLPDEPLATTPDDF